MTLKKHSLAPAAAQADGLALMIAGIAELDDKDLMTLRHELDKALRLDVNKLNLAEELGLQYRAGMTLLASIQDDKDVPANQRAQVFNSVGGMLDKINKQMKIVYSAERLKRYERALLKVLEELPDESKRVFFDLYGDFLKEEPAVEEAP